MHIRFPLSLAVALAVALVPSAGWAAGGLAYDSFSKLVTSGTPPPPGDFARDFAAASIPPTPPPHAGGMLGSMNALMQSAMAGLSAGVAERHYDAGQLHRVDRPATGTATITDCHARTMTLLNLPQKTYRVISLDTPDTSSHADSGPSGPSEPAPTVPPDSHFDMTVTNTALGPKAVFGMQTEGYTTHIITKSTQGGQTQNNEFDLTLYVTDGPGPDETCGPGGVPAGPPGMGMMVGMMMAIVKAMTVAMVTHNDPRFSVHSSGPSIPFNRFTPYQATIMKGASSDGSGGGSFATVEERANVRPISDADPAFRVPADFRKLP